MEPLVMVTERAVLDMYRYIAPFPTIETAVDLLGFVYSGAEAAVVTTVVPPQGENIVRGYAHVKLGGEAQAKAVDWFVKNALVQRRNGELSQMVVPSYLHVGHSHHGLGYEHYSGTDNATILKVVRDLGLEIAIGPLFTIKTQGPRISQHWSQTQRAFTRVRFAEEVDMKFYYLSKSMVARGLTLPIIVTPVIIMDTDLPPVPPLSWRYTNSNHYNEQLRHFQSAGCEVQVIEREIKDGPPFEIQMIVTNPDWNNGSGGIVNIVTKWDFPKTPPVFEVRKDGAMVEVKIKHWQPDMDLLEALLHFKEEGIL